MDECAVAFHAVTAPSLPVRWLRTEPLARSVEVPHGLTPRQAALEGTLDRLVERPEDQNVDRDAGPQCSLDVIAVLDEVGEERVVFPALEVVVVEVFGS